MTESVFKLAERKHLDEVEMYYRKYFKKVLVELRALFGGTKSLPNIRRWRRNFERRKREKLEKQKDLIEKEYGNQPKKARFSFPW
jgi:hypothetical protein